MLELTLTFSLYSRSPFQTAWVDRHVARAIRRSPFEKSKHYSVAFGWDPSVGNLLSEFVSDVVEPFREAYNYKASFQKLMECYLDSLVSEEKQNLAIRTKKFPVAAHVTFQGRAAHAIDAFSSAEFVAKYGEKRLMQLTLRDLDYIAWLFDQFLEEKRRQRLTDKGTTETLFMSLDKEWSLVKLIDKQAFEYEGHVMRHCIASYASLADMYTFVSVRHKGVSVASAQVDEKGRVSQFKGVKNSDPPKDAASLFEYWRKESWFCAPLIKASLHEYQNELIRRAFLNIDAGFMALGARSARHYSASGMSAALGRFDGMRIIVSPAADFVQERQAQSRILRPGVKQNVEMVVMAARRNGKSSLLDQLYFLDAAEPSSLSPEQVAFIESVTDGKGPSDRSSVTSYFVDSFFWKPVPKAMDQFFWESLADLFVLWVQAKTTKVMAVLPNKIFEKNPSAFILDRQIVKQETTLGVYYRTGATVLSEPPIKPNWTPVTKEQFAPLEIEPTDLDFTKPKPLRTKRWEQ